MRRLAHLALVLAAAGTLLSACHRPSDLPDGSVSRTKVDFQAPAAGGNPTAETLYVTNGGRGTLEAPTVTVSYQDGADWLTVTLTSSGDQYAIAVQPITTGLTAGTYRATLTLTWAGGSAEPTRVSVTLVVPSRAADPGYQPSVEAVAIDAPRGGGDPAPATFQVVNAGRGTLPVPSIDVAYAGTATGWLTTAVAAASEGYSVTAQARAAGLPSGVHHATLTLRATGGVVPARTLPVTLTVPPSEVALARHDVALVAPAGGFDVVGIVSAVNAGGGQLAMPVAAVSYEPGSAARWDGLLDVAVSGTPAQYQLRFTAHQVRSTPAGSSKLPPGTYTATVQVSAPGAAASDTVRVTLAVPAPVMQLSTSAVAFSEYTSCPLPAAATISVANAGGGTLATPGVLMEPGVDSWLAASVAVSGRDAYAVVLAPRAYPPTQAGGTVETTVQVTDPTGAASALPVRVRFDALAPDLAAVTVTPAPLNIWAQAGMGDPTPRTVSLHTPAGCVSPVVSVEAADGFDPTSWISIGASASSPHRFDVSVLTSVAGLAAGDRRAATLHLAAAGKTWDVPVNLTVGGIAAAGPMVSRGLYTPHVLTPLADGRVLATDGVTRLTEVFDPSTRTWSADGTLLQVRSEHGTVELDDGRVLVCGGRSDSTYRADCELGSRSSASGRFTWSAFGALTTGRSGVTLVTMPRGRVLVVSQWSLTPEVLDLATGRSTLLTGISGTRAAKRADGSILVAGGAANLTSWLYTPEHDTWAPAGNVQDGTPDLMRSPDLVPLADGRVMAAGGLMPPLLETNWAELWDARTRTWSRSVMPTCHNSNGGIALLSSGKVVATNGMTRTKTTATYGFTDLEVFDPATGKWSVVGTWAPTGTSATVVRLSSGMLLFADVTAWDPIANSFQPVAETYTW
jgi:hypothetical protein